VDLLVTLVQEPTRANGFAQDRRLVIFGLQLLKRVTKFHGEWANAAMPLLLRVTLIASLHPSCINFIFVFQLI
jgi:hypothetical protein